MVLSEDEAKVLLTILNQLNWKLSDAQVVMPIVNKLQGLVVSPEQKPEKNAKIASKPEVVDAKVIN